MIGATLRRNAPYFVGQAGNIMEGDQPQPDFGDMGGLQRQRPGWQSRVGQIGAMLLASGGNPLGGFLLRQAAAQQEAEQEREAYARRQADQQAEWQRRQQWLRDNPMPRQPTQTDRYVEEILNPATPPARRDLLRSIVQNPLAVFNPATGATEYQYEGGGAQGPQGLTDEELDALENGGPTPTASGGFP